MHRVVPFAHATVPAVRIIKWREKEAIPWLCRYILLGEPSREPVLVQVLSLSLAFPWPGVAVRPRENRFPIGRAKVGVAWELEKEGARPAHQVAKFLCMVGIACPIARALPVSFSFSALVVQLWLRETVPNDQ